MWKPILTSLLGNFPLKKVYCQSAWFQTLGVLIFSTVTDNGSCIMSSVLTIYTDSFFFYVACFTRKFHYQTQFHKTFFFPLQDTNSFNKNLKAKRLGFASCWRMLCSAQVRGYTHAPIRIFYSRGRNLVNVSPAVFFL